VLVHRCALIVPIFLVLTVIAAAARCDGAGMEVQADGWKLTAREPFGAVDPQKDSITVTRKGYVFRDGTLQATTHEDVLWLMGKLREPYPNGQKTIDNTVALSDYVYAEDVTGEGIANSSTLKYPEPLAAWVSGPWQFITDGRITLRLFCAHAHARFGSPVAAVELIVTDGSKRVSKVVDTLSNYMNPLTGYHVPVYEATLDLSTLADGQITADAIIYPHVGKAFQLSVNGETWPSYHPKVVQKHCQNSDGSLAVRYVYVDRESGGQGAVSSDLAEAKATPFATFNQAVEALAAGSRDAAGAVIVLKSRQKHRIDPKLGPITIGDYPLRVRPDGERSTVVDSGGRRKESMPSRVRWERITFESQGGNGLFSGTATGPDSFQVFSECRFDINGQQEPVQYFDSVGVCYFHNCHSNWSEGFKASDRGRHTAWHVVGSHGFANGSAHSCIGSYCNGQLRAQSSPGGALPTHRGDVFAFNVIETHGGANNIKTDDYECGPAGIAVVGNVGAITGKFNDDNVEFFGSAPEIAQNVVWMQNTWAGASHNGPRHNKGDTTNGDIRVFVRGNIFRSRKISGDYSKARTWQGDGPSPRVDNWPSRFGVGERFNYTYDPVMVEAFGSGPRTTADVPSWGSFYGRPGAADFPGFIKDSSAGGSNDHVDGDYHLVDDSAGANPDISRFR